MISARLLHGRKRIYSGATGLYAGQSLSYKRAALSKFGFVAPLKTNVFLERGAGAASFTRATVATVIDFEGNTRNCLSGEVRFQNARRVYNLLVNSDNVLAAGASASGVSGTGVSATCTAGATAPDGTATAFRVQLNKGAGTTTSDFAYWGFNFVRTVATSETARHSIWIKTNDGTTKVVGYRGAAPLTFTVTGEWQRLSTLDGGVNNQTAAQLILRGAWGTADTADLLIWHPQTEVVTGQSNQNPSEYVSVGAAKLNYLLVTEEFDSATWAKGNTTVTANASADYRGAQTADRVVETAINAQHFVGQSFTKAASAIQYTVSVYARAGERDQIQVLSGNAALTGYALAQFNLTAGTTTGTSVTGSFTGASASISDAGGGLWRCSITFTSDTDTTLLTRIYLGDGASFSYLGDITKGLSLSCAQIVQGSLTDYFPVGNVYPYHGACVDGVEYFDYTNPNRVVSNVVYSDVPTEPCEGYAVGQLPGATLGGFSTPATAANTIATDVEGTALLAMADWTPAASSTIAAKYNNSTDSEWLFEVKDTGALAVYLRQSGTANNYLSTIALPSAFAVDGTFLYVRFKTFFSLGKVRFYYSSDGVNWTQLGNDVSITETALASTSAPVTVGMYGAAGGAPLAGMVRRFYLRNVVTDAVVVDFNPRDGWTENKLTRSGEIQNAAWDKLATGTGSVPTVTDNFGVAPDGTTTATRIQLDIGAGTLSTDFAAVRQLTTADSQEHTRVLWVKLNSGSSAVVRFFDALMTTVTTEWQKITFTGALGSDFRVGQLQGNVATAKSADILVWCPQLRRAFDFGSPSLDSYVPTTSAARRGWYPSTTGEFWDANGMASYRKTMRPRYLPEGAGTNLVLQSSNFGTTWGQVNTPTRSAAAKYCGDIALDLIGDDDAGLLEYFNQTVTFTGDGVKSLSCYIAQGTSTSSVFRIRDDTVAAERLNAAVTWANGVPVVTMTTGTQERPPEAMGGGIWRIFLASASITAANVNTIQVIPATTAGLAAANTGDVYIGGVQAENATFASSHIPTTTGTATRNADILTYSATGNASYPLTIYAEATRTVDSGGAQVLVDVNDGGGNTNASVAAINATDKGECYVRSGGVDQADALSSAAISVGASVKLAAVIASNRANSCLNGVLSTEVTTVTVPAAQTLITIGVSRLNYNSAYIPIGPVMVAQRADTNEELLALTA